MVQLSCTDIRVRFELLINREIKLKTSTPSKTKSFWKPLERWFRYCRINGFE